MFTCVIAIVAFKEHHTFHGFKHFVVSNGVIANFLACCLIPSNFFLGLKAAWKEPYSSYYRRVVGIWGLIYFFSSSKSKAKAVYTTAPAT